MSADQGWFVMKRLVDERNALVEAYQHGLIRGAFFALGMVGIAFRLITNEHRVGTQARHNAATDRRFQKMRVALIGLLWNAVADDESCDGDCEEDGPPFAVCQAMRALGWGGHFDAKQFELRASR